MTYFPQAYDHIRYALATEDQPGFRTSQIGALHALSAHFTLHERPAVIVLPTGAGKTAVLMLTPVSAARAACAYYYTKSVCAGPDSS